MEPTGDAEQELARGSGVITPRDSSESPAPKTPPPGAPVADVPVADAEDPASAEKHADKKLPSLAQKIENLKKQQAEQRQERQKLAQELKNAQRKRRRLKERARGLSDADLATVIALRASEADRAAERQAAQQAPSSENRATRASASASAGA